MNEPIALRCDSCGASLPTKTKRKTICAFCGTLTEHNELVSVKKTFHTQTTKKLLLLLASVICVAALFYSAVLGNIEHQIRNFDFSAHPLTRITQVETVDFANRPTIAGRRRFEEGLTSRLREPQNRLVADVLAMALYEMYEYLDVRSFSSIGVGGSSIRISLSLASLTLEGEQTTKEAMIERLSSDGYNMLFALRETLELPNHTLEFRVWYRTEIVMDLVVG